MTNVRVMREQRAWSQEQLAEFSGLSIRTIQRIENGSNATIESLKSLAAVFDTQLSELQEDRDMNIEKGFVFDEELVKEYVKARRKLVSHFGAYLFVLGVMVAIFFMEPQSRNSGELVQVGFGWGIGVLMHFFYVATKRYQLFSEDWEVDQLRQKVMKTH